MITGKVEVANAEAVELTITLTASVEHWRLIAEALGEAPRYPRWEFANRIREAIHNTVCRTESVQELNGR